MSETSIVVYLDSKLVREDGNFAVNDLVVGRGVSESGGPKLPINIVLHAKSSNNIDMINEFLIGNSPENGEIITAQDRLVPIKHGQSVDMKGGTLGDPEDNPEEVGADYFGIINQKANMYNVLYSKLGDHYSLFYLQTGGEGAKNHFYKVEDEYMVSWETKYSRPGMYLNSWNFPFEFGARNGSAYLSFGYFEGDEPVSGVGCRWFQYDTDPDSHKPSLAERVSA